ncbi:hypothetical protein IE53DRAFT_311915 [Violaceomyces palustris]|uniref:Uncharacterized protein n=1 Tax=Violaceomyces palustris TaxID=1673888 RepID=A0ACD0P367_9BASI|nr:hypothetical protein IE53DRAFT_311915 [Violaceomyces palustris]
MRSLSRRSADELRTSPQRRFGADVGLILDWVRALILISYDSYGRNELKLADEYIRLACEIALGAGLNLVDSKGNFQDPSDASSDCRRAWWELYIAELMLFATTSGEVPRHFDDTSMSVLVNSPLDPGETNQSEAYDIRVRTAAIVNESIKPPADPCRPELSRLQAIDTMISNLLVRAQSTWAGLALETSQHSSGQPTPASQTKLEITFTAMVILHAARIHLHRQAWFSDLTMDFESCSFKPKNTPVKDLAPGSIEGQDEGCEDCSLSSPKAAIRRTRIAASVAKIVSVSDLSSTEKFPFEVPAHWPFFNCCQLVAAFGYVVAVAASGAEENGSFPMSTSAPTAAIWKLRAALSNIRFAEATLTRYSVYWPIAEVYREEVRRCRNAVDFSGPTGLGSPP